MTSHRTRLLALAAATVVMLLATASSAQGYHRWFTGGKWIHQHTTYFGVYSADEALHADATAWGEQMWSFWVEPITMEWNHIHDESQIHVLGGDYGATGWVGLYETNQGWDGTGHYTHGHMHYNRSYLSTSTEQRYAVACHELGHGLGLNHGDTGCMASAPLNPFPGGDDVGELNAAYTSPH